MSESQEVSALSDKPKRRTLTPEQRIAERQAEIVRIQEKQREKVLELTLKAMVALRDAHTRATTLGMTTEAERIHGAIKAMEAKG